MCGEISFLTEVENIVIDSNTPSRKLFRFLLNNCRSLKIIQLLQITLKRINILKENYVDIKDIPCLYC